MGSFDLVPDRDGTDERKKDGSGGFSEKEDWEVATEEDEARHVRSSRDRVGGLAVTTGPPGRGDMNEGAPDYLRCRIVPQPGQKFDDAPALQERS